MVARRKGRLGTYRVSRVLDCRLLARRFVTPVSFQLASHWSAEVARFERSLQRASATIRVRNAALSRIERLGADAADAVRAAVPDGRGWRTAEVPIEALEHAALELLGFGPHVRVLRPLALARRIRALAVKVAASHAQVGTSV